MMSKSEWWGMPARRAPDALTDARLRAWSLRDSPRSGNLPGHLSEVDQGDRLAPARFHDGTLEALKWIALLLMVGDHVNKYLFNWEFPWLFNAGRVVMPVFALVMGYNLARPGLGREGFRRIMTRLAVVGLVSTPVFIALGKLYMGWYPLNILFMLLVAVAAIDQIERGQPVNYLAAGALLLIGGAFVEYWWPGVLLVLCSWRYFRRGSLLAAFGAVVVLGLLTLINGNAWAFAAVPLILLAHFVRVGVPRSRWAFYAFYPAHLAVLLAVQWLGLWSL